MSVIGSKDVEQYKKKHLLLESFEVEKELIKRIVANEEATEFEFDSILSEFEPYVSEYFKFLKPKLLQFYDSIIKNVEEFVLENDSNHPETRKKFGLQFGKDKFKSVYFPVYEKLKNGNMEEKKNFYMLFRRLMKSEVNTNWETFRYNVFENKRIIDCIPLKYHKQFMG